MRLYVDQMMRQEVTHFLCQHGHDAIRAGEIGEARADDAEILKTVCSQGRILITLLDNFDCDILLYDPFCDKKEAVSMGARKVESLERLFSECKVISLHAPSNESTKGMINGSHFKLLQDGAVFINTARGAVVNENDMVEELRKERFVACIDVTDPEPPASDSPLRSLPNVLLTPHEAGVIAENMRRIGALVAEQVECFVKGEDVPYEVTQKSLSRMA